MGLGIKAPPPPPAETQGLISREAESLYWPHGEPGAWFNPWWPNPGSRVSLLKWKFLYRNEFTELKTNKTPDVPVVTNDGAYLSKAGEEPSITCVGHCGFIIQDGPNVILTDPHFGARALLYRRHQPPGVPAASIPGGAVATISHNHYDHLDSWTIENLPEDVAWFVPKGLGAFVESLGRRAVELDWWRKCRARRCAPYLPARAALVEPVRHGEGLHALVRLAHRDRYAQVFSRRGQRLFSRV